METPQGIYYLVHQQRWHQLSDTLDGDTALECLEAYLQNSIREPDLKFLMGTIDSRTESFFYFFNKRNGTIYSVVVTGGMHADPESAEQEKKTCEKHGGKLPPEVAQAIKDGAPLGTGIGSTYGDKKRLEEADFS